ncbi:MAG: aldo/keto reductase [Bacteroidia bacterium]|nr:aldo/keto reductase [Bacteroidia bacterium]
MVTNEMPQRYTTLNNGIQMPLLGLGVYDMYHSEAVQAVSWALEIGYRLIDTAALYRNEAEIGQAVRESTVPRAEIFITTKVHNQDQGYDNTLRAFEESLRKLNCDYIDLYLIHWPLKATRRETWRALEQLYMEGRVRAIGVANYLLPFLDELATYAQVVPVVNQVEFSPYLYQQALLQTCQQRGIVLQAYTPLIRGQRMHDPRLKALAYAYDKTPAQIILRWAIQLGVSTIPKSARRSRLEENFQVFDFELSADDMAILATFDEGLRIVDDPMLMW